MWEIWYIEKSNLVPVNFKTCLNYRFTITVKGKGQQLQKESYMKLCRYITVVAIDFSLIV